MKACLALAGFALLLAGVGPVQASGVPCSGTSTVIATAQGTPGCDPNIAVVCPAGDRGLVRVVVTVKDCYGTPLAGKTVSCDALQFSGALCFCTGQDPQTGVTNVNGEVTFNFVRFGGCGGVQFVAICDAVTLGPSSVIGVRSPDITGDCLVNALDLSRFGLIYGTSDPCGDYNCDGTVNALDLSTFGLHYGHVCP
jgi:hypothetical protein